MSILGDAWNWTKGAAGDVWSGLKSSVGGQTSFRPTAPKLDQAVANEDRRASLMARGQQSALNQQFSDQIAGMGPSVAEIQQQQGIAQAMQNASRQAANARGVSRGLAQRSALYSGLGAQAQAARDAALLREQERITAQQQLAQNLAQERQQDLASRGLSLQAAQGDVNAITAQQGQLTQIASGNAERAQKGTGAALSFAGPLLGSVLSDVRAKEDVAPLTPEPMPRNASGGAPKQSFGQALKSAMSSAGTGLMGQPAPQQQALPPQAPSMPAMMPQAGGIQPTQAMPAPASSGGYVTPESLSSGMGAAGQGLMLSDERSKENLDPLTPYRYRYRPEFAAALAEQAASKVPPPVADDVRGEVYADARAPREGVMAQDLEASPEGRKAVIKGKSTLRAIDEKRALSFALGQMAGLNKRLEKLEGGVQ
jgi:hypothetical protein